MAQSKHSVNLCLIYDSQQHIARWVVPSTASTLMKVNPYVELIEENHKFFDEYAKLAGEKPKVYTP